MNEKLIPPEPGGVQEIALREALEERYLAYALSTIMHRALPDAQEACIGRFERYASLAAGAANSERGCQGEQSAS